MLFGYASDILSYRHSQWILKVLTYEGISTVSGLPVVSLLFSMPFLIINPIIRTCITVTKVSDLDKWGHKINGKINTS